MRIIFFGTSNVALPILEALSREHEIAAAVTMPDAKVGRNRETEESPVSVLAKEMSLEALKPVEVKNNLDFLNRLKVLNADLFAVVAYGKILPVEIINLPKYKTINVHFSLLPKYRGASPIQSALLNGDAETGTTIFILSEKMDNGPVIAQQKITIDSDDNYITLSQKLAFLSAKLLTAILPDYVSGKIKPIIQDESQSSYTKIIKKQDGQVDWKKTAPEIYNQFRAYYPWPGIWTKWEGKILKITDCSATNLQTASESTNTYECGQVLDGGIVACSAGTFLQINKLQLEGKTETAILDFLNGYREFIGSRLE